MLSVTGGSLGSVGQQLLQDKEHFIPKARAVSADSMGDEHKGSRFEKKKNFPESQGTNIRVQWLHINNLTLKSARTRTIL